MAAVPGHHGWSASSPSLPPPSQATHPPPPRGAHASLISRHRGLLRPTAVCQRRHAAMHPSELNVELVRPRVTHHWLRLIAGSRVVVPPSPGSSPPVRTPLCPPYVCDRWARGPHCQPLWCRARGIAWGAHSNFRSRFLKRVF
jgi:hypothetical protein